GDLDVYVSNYKKLGAKDIWDAGELLFEFVVDKSGEKPRIAEEYQEHFVLEIREDRLLFLEVGEKDILLINEGNGIFNKASFFNGRFKTKNGIMEKDLKDWGLLVRFQDFDNDGDPDIYVCNDFESPDRLWINNGEGQFSLMPKLAVRNTSAGSMGIDFADIDRNGTMDYFVVEMLSRSHKRRKTQMGP
ncbi:MAG: VCBS repeat-containing protein, partial [Candidatus Marinimicrobia bacterium]|nr:VCBS repeat-containing protein [Candidatus Neomarinimicrobiota bacterium]